MVDPSQISPRAQSQESHHLNFNVEACGRIDGEKRCALLVLGIDNSFVGRKTMALRKFVSVVESRHISLEKSSETDASSA